MKKTKNKAVEITRTFSAPKEKVWKAWSDPKEFKKWWGPKDFTAPVIKIDFRKGGRFLGAMHGPKGTEFDKDIWSTGVYKEIVPSRKIVVTDSFADEKGNIVPSTFYGMQGFPREMLVTVKFKELDGDKTKMTLTHSGTDKISDQDRNNMKQGWNQSFDKMQLHVESESN